MEQTCFCAKQTNAQMPLLYLQFRNFQPTSCCSKKLEFESISRGENTFNWLFHLNYPTKWSGRPSWRCNLFTSPMGPMYSIKLHIYNIATNDVKNDMKPQVIRSHLPQKESAGSAGRLKPRVAGQKDVKHRLVCSNWASQTFFQNFIGLAKACRFFGFKGQHQLEAEKPFHEYV